MLWTVCLVLLSASLASCSQDLVSGFTLRFVRMCLKPEFTKELEACEGSTEIGCASACAKLGASCHGFQLTGGGGEGGATVRCVAFVFDKCSHMVRTDCSQSAWAYVRNQAGLPDGQLCPDGFGNGYFGSNYKMVSAASWTDGLSKCGSLPGLTKYADAMDWNETEHLNWIKAAPVGGISFFVGGWRPGSSASNPWFWQACNISVASGLWSVGEPSGLLQESFLAIYNLSAFGMHDIADVHSLFHLAACECIDPFL